MSKAAAKEAVRKRHHRGYTISGSIVVDITTFRSSFSKSFRGSVSGKNNI
jgi:hypothetical protein